MWFNVIGFVMIKKAPIHRVAGGTLFPRTPFAGSVPLSRDEAELGSVFPNSGGGRNVGNW